MVFAEMTEARAAQYLNGFKKKTSDEFYKLQKNRHEAFGSDKSKVRDRMAPICDKFFETEEYKSGDKEYEGYRYCCDMYGLCECRLGWWIFFIIVIVIGCLAAAGAAFWFFYLKRKMGGRDEQEKDVDSEESSTKKSDYDISIDTY